jgi:hypothetical protein
MGTLQQLFISEPETRPPFRKESDARSLTEEGWIRQLKTLNCDFTTFA